MILGIFHKFPYFSGINPAQAENPIFYVLMFQGPKRRPNDLKIYEHQYLEGRRLWSEGSKQAEAHAAWYMGHVGPLLLGLGAPLPLIFSPPTPS